MKRKIFSVLLTLVLVLSFSLVTAAPAAAQTSQYGTWYLASGGTGGAAAWSTAQAHDDTYSANLTAGTQSGTSYGRVWKPVDITLADITDVSFWHYLSSSSQVDHSSWPMYLEEGETYSDTTGYFTPYVTLKITDGAADHWLITQQFVRDPDNGTWAAGWEQWQMSDNAAEYPAASGMDPTETLWHDELWTDNATTGGSGAYATGWEYLSFFQTTYSGYDVVELKVSMGGWAITTDQTAYVDDITVTTSSATTYAVEPRVFIGATPYGAIDTAIAAASADATINVSSGTFCATTFPIDVNVSGLTIQSVSGAASTIIDPGSTGQGVLKINQEGVTIDGFTIKGGSQAYSASNPQENAIWIMDNYSTIKNNTIINYRGNQAGIYIGDRQSNVPTGAVFGYIPATPANSRLGHTIQDNTFRQAGAGEGWGIFAYDLSDSLIHGNSFVGEADVGDGRTTPWNTNEGAPGTGIIIHKATAGAGSPSPGGGYVIIEDNTARYVKYTWLTFYAAYMYTDSTGYGYEQPEDSTVDKVIVRNNTVYDCGKDDDWTSGTAVNFARAKKDSAYGDKGADLTVGTADVTIGPKNTFYNLDYGVKVDNPRACTDSAGYACVLTAENIVVKHNAIYGCESYGLYNGTGEANSEDADTIVAQYNWWGTAAGAYHATTNPSVSGYRGDAVSGNVTYAPWLYLTAATTGDTVADIVTNQVPAYANAVVLSSGWNTFSVPIGLDGQYNTWAELYDLTSANYSIAYRFNPTTQEFESLATTDTDAVAPGEGFYIKMNEAGSLPYCYSTVVSIPSRALGDGWNFIGGGLSPRSEIDSCASIITAGGTAGYTHMVNPASNTDGSQVYISGASTFTLYAGEGFWVFLPIDRTLGLFDLTPVTWVP